MASPLPQLVTHSWVSISYIIYYHESHLYTAKHSPYRHSEPIGPSTHSLPELLPSRAGLTPFLLARQGLYFLKQKAEEWEFTYVDQLLLAVTHWIKEKN